MNFDKGLKELGHTNKFTWDVTISMAGGLKAMRTTLAETKWEAIDKIFTRNYHLCGDRKYYTAKRRGA